MTAEQEKNEADANPPKKSRRWLRWTLGAFGLAVLALLGAFFFATSNYAVQTIWLPMAREQTGAEIEIADFSASLGGNVWIEDFRFRDFTQGVTVYGPSIRVDVAILSLLGETPVVSLIEVDSPYLILEEKWLPPVPHEENEDKKNALKKSSGDTLEPEEYYVISHVHFPKSLVPIGIEKMEITDAVVWIWAEDREIQFRAPKVMLADFNHGKSAILTARTTFVTPTPVSPAVLGWQAMLTKSAVPAENSVTPLAGRSSWKIVLTQNSDGSAMDWEAKGQTTFDEIPKAGGGALPEKIHLFAEFSGSIDVSGAIHSEFALRTDEDGDPLIEAANDVQFIESGEPGPAIPGDQIALPAMTASTTVTIGSLGPELLNPILAMIGGEQLESGSIQGSLTASMENTIKARRSEVAVSLRGGNLRLAATEAHGATPPLEFDIEQEFAYDSSTGVATLDRIEAHWSQGGTKLAELRLDEPVKVALAADGDAEVEKKATGEPLAKIELKMNDVALEDLRPWVEAVAPEALESIRGGRLAADFEFAIGSADGDFDITGDFGWHGFSLRPSSEAEFVGPLDVTSKINGNRGRLEGLSMGTLKGFATLEGERIAEWTAGGAYGEETGSIQFDVVSEIPDLALVADRFALIPAEAGLILNRGAMYGEIHAEQKSEDVPLQFSGKADLRSLETERAGATLARTSKIEWAGSVDSEFAELTLDSLKVQMTDTAGANGGTGEGTVRITGHWPLAFEEKDGKTRSASGRGGKIEIKARDFDLGPWMEFAGLRVGEESVGAWPASADETVSIDVTGEEITLEGEARIGPIRFAAPQQAAREMEIEARQSVELRGEELKAATIEYERRERGKVRDKIEANLSGAIGERPDLKLTAKIESLDADFYADLMPPEDSEQEADEEDDAEKLKKKAGKRESESEKERRREEANEPMEIPLDLDAQFEIGKITWREVTLTEGRASVTADAERLQFELATLSVNDGQTSGSATLELQGGEQKATWGFAGARLPVAPVVDSVQPSLAGKIEGTGEFRTDGSATIDGDGGLGDLDGKFTFHLRDGELHDSDLLSVIADFTHVEEFKDFKFLRFDGDVDLVDDRAVIREAKVTGGTLRLAAEGEVTLEEELDMEVFVAVGPPLNEKIPEYEYLRYALEGPDGFATIPGAVRVKGTIDDPKYRVKLKWPSPLETVRDGLKGILRGDGVGGRLLPKLNSILEEERKKAKPD